MRVPRGSGRPLDPREEGAQASPMQGTGARGGRVPAFRTDAVDVIAAPDRVPLSVSSPVGYLFTRQRTHSHGRSQCGAWVGPASRRLPLPAPSASSSGSAASVLAFPWALRWVTASDGN